MGGVASAALVDGLYAYYPFESNAAGAGGVLDTSGNSRNGTGPIGGSVTTVVGKVGNALDFSGANGAEVVIDQVAESDFDFINSDFTVQAWVTVHTWTKDWQTLMAKGEGGGWRFARRGNSGTDVAYNMGNGDTQIGNFNDGGWHHLVGVHENGVITRLYLDGSQLDTSNGNGPGDRAGVFTIGDNPEANNRNWDGLIDEVAIWDRALDLSEVTALYFYCLTFIYVG